MNLLKFSEANLQFLADAVLIRECCVSVWYIYVYIYIYIYIARERES